MLAKLAMPIGDRSQAIVEARFGLQNLELHADERPVECKPWSNRLTQTYDKRKVTFGCRVCAAAVCGWRDSGAANRQ